MTNVPIPCNTTAINSWKTAGAVYSLSCSFFDICQYSLFRSREEKYFDFPNRASISLITGRGYEFLLVTWFNFRKSTQNLFEPSFLSTMTTGKFHGDLDLLTIPASSISSRVLSMTSLTNMKIRN